MLTPFMELLMGKVLIFSDIHIFPHKKKNERLEDCLQVLRWVFETAKKEKINTILFGGDFFHDRQKIEIYTYQKTFEILRDELDQSKIELFLLLGNHDIWFNDNTDISSVMPLSAIRGVRVIKDPERIRIEEHNWDFIPFTHNPIESIDKLKKENGKEEYALGHLAIDGAVLHNNQYSDVSVEHEGEIVTISPSIFSEYKHTFLGHYHAEQRVNKNVEYIGSPLELSFGEAFQNKHIIIFDGDTNKIEYVENKFSPKHLIVDFKECKKFDLNNNFVQIKVEDSNSADLLSLKKEILQESKPFSLEIKQKRKEIEKHTIQNAKAILLKGDEMLEKYVEEVGAGNLEKEALISIGKKICKGEK
jgi:DNA repair exonuclease SbcCD nuclease subunit